MGKIYFTSDQHYGHPNSIVKCDRPFDCIEHMNDRLVDAHNDVVTDADTVFMLGDFSLSLKWVDEVGHRLKGKKFLVPGNHDWCHEVHKNGESRQKNVIKRYADVGITVVGQQLEFPIGDVPMLLCHFPYFEAHKGAYHARYKEWRPRPGPEYALLCGHVHHFWKIRRHEPSGYLMYNVGVDVQGFKPVSAEKIFEDINEFIASGYEEVQAK